MSVPAGYCTVREAIETVLEAQRAGEEFTAAVRWSREAGVEASYDRGEWDRAIAFFWSEIQAGRIDVVAEQPSSGRMVRLMPDDLGGIPHLYRSTGDLSFLRASNPAHGLIHERFGAPGRVQLLVEIEAVRRLTKRARAMRRRQVARAQSASDVRLGRPAKLPAVMEAIRKLVEKSRWRAPQSVKALTNEVNKLDRTLEASDATVRRALDRLYETTGDRQYLRASGNRRRKGIQADSGAK